MLDERSDAIELLPAVVGLAVVDSINPSALLATIVLLLGGRPARPLVAVYVAAVLVTYFAIGLVLLLGLGLTPEALLESDVAYLAQGVLGTALLAYAVLAPDRGRRRDPAANPRLPAARRPAAVFGLGVAVTFLELPTAFPYLGAVGAITRAGLAVEDWLPLLAAYNLIFVLPPLALLAAHIALGDRAGALLERLRARLGGAAREGLLWLLGLVGFVLVADALGHFGVVD